MKRGLVVAVAGAAVLAAGLTGCSKDEKKSTASSATASASASASMPGGGAATTGTGTAKVTVDGKAQDVKGSIVCATAAGQVAITIGDATGGLSAVLSEGDAPEVKAVGLGNVGGSVLAYAPGVPDNEAKATKDGKTYKITGTVTAVDMANPTAPAKKPFDMEVTCP